VGVLVLRVGPGPGARRRPSWPTCRPRTALIRLPEDLAFEVAVRARQIEEQRGSRLVIDSLPCGLYVVDREHRIQIWNRKRETGTQGVHRDEVVGRPVFEVLTRQSAEQLKGEFDQIFESGQMSQMDIEVDDAAGGRFYRISKIPMRLGGDQISHVITIGEDVTDWYRIHRRIMQKEAGGAWPPGSCTITTRRHHRGVRRRSRTLRRCPPAQGVGYIDIIDKEVDRCTNIDGLPTSAGPRAQKNPG
jgi:PAS domain S-box-containing protein